MRSARSAFFVGVVALGCAGPRAAPTPPVAPLAFEVASNDGTYLVSYAPRPSPIPLNAEFALDVLVRDAARRTVAADVSLAVDATMPDHGHGMNVVPRVVAAAPGRFVVEGLVWHMPGSWEIVFDVTRDAVTERAQKEVVID